MNKNKYQYSTFRGGKVAYKKFGKGRVVVLLHGFLESMIMYNELIPILSNTYRVLAIDLPGHGKTDCFGYIHTMELMAESIQSVLKSEKVRRSIIVGHSMGGYVALAFADLYPDKVAGLCLYHSTSLPDTKEKKIQRTQAIELVKTNHKSFIRIAFPKLFRHKFRSIKREQISWYKKEALTTTKQGIVASLEGMKNRKSRELLLKFPPYKVLILTGKNDPIIPFQSIQEQSHLSNKIELITLKEAGHMSYIEEPENAFKAIREFCKKVY